MKAKEKKRVKNPEATKKAILDSAFSEIYKYGYQAASLDRIISSTGVTRGALYHHFKNKKDLGYAVFDEVTAPLILDRWVPALEKTDDPVKTIKVILKDLCKPENEELVALGCPLNNITQEMSPIDEEYRKRIESVLKQWRQAVSGSMKKAIKNNILKKDIDPNAIGLFTVCSIEGAFGMAKNFNSLKILKTSFSCLGEYLDTLYINQ